MRGGAWAARPWYMAAPMRTLVCVLRFAVALSLPGCSCSRLHGEVDGFEFTRCAQADPPRERTLHTGQLELSVRDRRIEVKPKGELRVATFTGPVGAQLARGDLAALAALSPGLVIVLGGLGDEPGVANANLAMLASLRVPVLVIAGGADRLSVLDEALDELGDKDEEWLVQASSARELRIGRERFAIIAGSPLGRYALDDRSCGFTAEDLDDIEEALSDSGFRNGRTWLLSWAAPSGWGITLGHGDVDIGSAELSELAARLAAKGGLFAYPETQAFAPREHAGQLALVVPRLGRTGSLRADGGFVPRAVALLRVGGQGISLVR